MKNILLFIPVFILLVGFTGCEKDLEVENTNNPDKERALSNPDDLMGIAKSLYQNWFVAAHEYEGLGLAMWVAADNGTCSWGNAGMQDMSTEPRLAWNNDNAYPNAIISRAFFNSIYSSLSQANDVLLPISEGVEIGAEGEDTKMVEAFSRFVQGISLGYIALNFDQGYIVDETTDLAAGVEFVPYDQIQTAALEKLDMAIEICNNNTFVLPDSWINGAGTIDNNRLKRIVSTYAARLLAYMPRNADENAAVDWNKVYTYASNGVQEDFMIMADGESWASYYKFYASYSGWGQVDMRIVNLMDPEQPARWPEGGYSEMPNGGVMNSDDARADTDFQFLAAQGFNPGRGEYHFSTYRHSRYDDYVGEWPPFGEVYVILKDEADMLMAEAKARTGAVSEAVTLVNESAWTTRGQLDPLSTSDQAEALKAIFYERTIELFLTGVGIPFYDMRRRDMLQKGTPLHWPVPGKELETMQLPLYSFGGVANADGENTSNGGWTEETNQ